MSKDDKIVKIDQGLITIEEGNGEYEWFGELCIDYFNRIEIGRCSCCGGKNIIVFQGNAVDIRCDQTEIKGFQCKLHDNGCPGVNACVNNDMFDPERRKKVDDVLNKLVVSIFEAYGRVLIRDCIDSKEVIANHFLKDETLEIQTMDIEKPSKKKERWFVIKKDDKVINNRKELEAISKK